MDRKEKQRVLDVFCGMQERCDGGCPLFMHCPERNFNTLRDAEIDDLYDHYISNPKCRVNVVSEPGSQDAKADAGKLPMNLVPTQIDRDIAQVRQYGNAKYGDPDNWRKVEKIRYVAALERHLLAYKDYLNGDDDGLDKESGIEHYKHMACNMAFICEMERWEKKE